MRTKDLTKEAQIQDATASIILQQGATAVSTVKVAKKVGISQSNIYLYFKNKDELLLSVYHRELNRIQKTGSLERISDDQLDLEQRIKIYIRSVFDYAIANPDSLTLIQEIKFLLGQYDHNPFLQTDQSQNAVHTLLQEAIDAKVIKSVPVNIHMSLVFSVIHTHVLNIQRNLYDTRQYPFEQFYKLIWQGMQF